MSLRHRLTTATETSKATTFVVAHTFLINLSIGADDENRTHVTALRRQSNSTIRHQLTIICAKIHSQKQELLFYLCADPLLPLTKWSSCRHTCQ